MANNTKFTQVQALSAIRDYIADNHMADGEEFQGIPSNVLVEKLNAMILSIEKKKSHTSEKDKAKAEENNRAREIILDVLSGCDTALSIAEIYEDSEELKNLLNSSNQRITSILTKMKNEGYIVRTEVKGKAHYSINSDEVDG